MRRAQRRESRRRSSGLPARALEILRGYSEGRRSVQDVLQVCQSYRGPEPHFFWATVNVWHRSAVINYCFEQLPEEKLYELFVALIGKDPDFPRIRNLGTASFLDVAHDYAGRAPEPAPAASGRILVLLAVPGTTRSIHHRHPLHKACWVPNVDAGVINHLINLDPDVLMKFEGTGRIPLHGALVVNPTGSFISRMIEVRPTSLCWTSDTLGTPVAAALWQAQPSPEVARILLGLVLQCPGSVTIPTGFSLMHACCRFHEYPELIKAIVQADPPALVVASLDGENRAPLPFQLVATANPITREFVEKERFEVALAVVEHVLGAVYAPKRGVYKASHVAIFRRHVWRTVATYLDPDERPIGTSGFAVAQAVRRLDMNRRMDLCRDVFCGHERSRRLLTRPLRMLEQILFHEDLMGNLFEGLCRLNRRDRSKVSWAHQVRLLESVSDNLDCVYLHFRVVACGILLADGR